MDVKHIVDEIPCELDEVTLGYYGGVKVLFIYMY